MPPRMEKSLAVFLPLAAASRAARRAWARGAYVLPLFLFFRRLYVVPVGRPHVGRGALSHWEAVVGERAPLGAGGGVVSLGGGGGSAGGRTYLIGGR